MQLYSIEYTIVYKAKSIERVDIFWLLPPFVRCKANFVKPAQFGILYSVKSNKQKILKIKIEHLVLKREKNEEKSSIEMLN